MADQNQQRKKTIIGWILTGIPVMFLLLDGVLKLIMPDEVVKGSLDLGYPSSVILPLGESGEACISVVKS